MQNPFETDELPVFTFPPPPPPPRGAAEVSAPPVQVQSSRAWGIVIIALVVLSAVGFIVLGISQQNFSNAPQQASAPQPPSTAPIATSRGQVQSTCPGNLQAYATCWALDLPASGQWVRWVLPTTAPATISGASGIVARGCKGEIYDLGKGGQSFNSACGHLDYRATDKQTHRVYLGVK